jgi:hypothetical protein
MPYVQERAARSGTKPPCWPGLDAVVGDSQLLRLCVMCVLCSGLRSYIEPGGYILNLLDNLGCIFHLYYCVGSFLGAVTSLWLAVSYGQGMPALI